MSIGYFPWNRPAAAADRPCLRDPQTELTYGQVNLRVEAITEQLAERGIGNGDVVAIMLPNRVELLLVILAAWKIGAVATPLNPAFTVTEARYQLDDSRAALLVTDRDPAGYHVPVLDVRDLATLPAGTGSPARSDPADIALLIYTSGSTGRPKGVMLDHANLRAMTSMLAGHLHLGADDHCLLVLPLFHVNSLCVSFLAPMLVGAQITILPRFAPDTFLAAVREHRPTYFSAVPTIYARLAELPDHVRADLTSVRFAVCGAAPMPRELLERCADRFGIVIVEGYGLTEGTCASTCNPLDGPRKLGTVGPPLPGQQVKIVDEAGRECATGQAGEVVIAGPNVMRGYLNRPEATAETVRGGLLHTGDVGYLDEDGYLVLVDRIKDMIIRGGENIYPKEIEAALCRHDAVLEAAVIGEPHPVYGEVPVAFVVRYPGATATAEELLEHCRRDLTKVKLPARISIVDALPRNPVGKIDKPALRSALPVAR
ncbi:long-chain-fatty-acid--CoA ligase [Amycolatopsis deserti]|uniref:Long-chain-fatty-acid--CoA ligase n=1 Tax=Amycolatopsis deserti TaxID=185696 RepID=A0ABQ3ITU6_9PSEU|nr:AMP-binding protein [Amycolatopsis deserti]GHE93627.1 long-chain-fatty-acid--CoA ligase [Amycolatopsis deserti]